MSSYPPGPPTNDPAASQPPQGGSYAPTPMGMPPQGQAPAGMPPQGPPVPGTYSPDGRFVWNGQTWVPSTYGMPPKSNMPWLPWVLGGCGCLVLLVIALFVFLIVVGHQVQVQDNNVFSNISNGLNS